MSKTAPPTALAINAAAPQVGVVMGSVSDWSTLQVAVDILRGFAVACEARVISAHRTPDWLFDYAANAEARGLKAIIAGAGGAAHLPGMLAAKTIIPVFGVPVQSKALSGLDSLLSIVQMPRGVPVPTLAIGEAGAANAALVAIAVLATHDTAEGQRLRLALQAHRAAMRDQVMAATLPPATAI